MQSMCQLMAHFAFRNVVGDEPQSAEACSQLIASTFFFSPFVQNLVHFSLSSWPRENLKQSLTSFSSQLKVFFTLF